MLDTRFIGHEFPEAVVEIDKGLLRLFAKATGQTHPIHFDEAAAQAAGHRSIVAPLTYGFSLLLAAHDPFPILPLMKLDQRRCLHGEQSFTYRGLMFAGDRIRLRTRVSDVYEKANGRLGFVVMQTCCLNQLDEPVLDMSITTVVRQG